MGKWLLKPLILLSCGLISSSAFALDVTLKWDEVTQDGLAGYFVYYKRGGSGPPYNGTGADQGPSPVQVPVSSLADPSNPAFDLTGLPDDVFCFVATAYDTNGLESDYSNEDCNDLPPPADGIPPPPPEDFRIKSIDYSVEYDVQGLPVGLFDASYDSATVTVELSNAPAAGEIVIVLDVYDADFVDEGRLVLNGVEVSALFPGGNTGFDAKWQTIEVPTSSGLWLIGTNTLVFRHDKTQGYEIRGIELERRP